MNKFYNFPIMFLSFPLIQRRIFPQKRIFRCVFRVAEFRKTVRTHSVSIPVQLLETQPSVVLPLNLLYGIAQQVPDLRHIFLIHGHGERTDAHLVCPLLTFARHADPSSSCNCSACCGVMLSAHWGRGRLVLRIIIFLLFCVWNEGITYD